MALKIDKTSSILFFLLLFIINLQMITSTKLVEGDMLLSDEQYDLLYSSDSDSMRNGLMNVKYRWPNGVMPYVINEDDFDNDQKKLILEVIKKINSVSCVIIRPKTSNDKHWILISDANLGCSSYVGYRAKPNQLVAIKNGPINTNCFRFGSIAHELLHALGFYHLHSTFNRDDFVKINWNNIRSGREHNFKKYGKNIVTNYEFSYDFDSVLHYGSFAFSKNGKPTITPKVETRTYLGQRSHLSKIDIKKLNAMYGCGY